MTTFQFYEVMLDRIGVYIICLFFSCLFSFILLKRICDNVLDPIFSVLVLAIFANAIPPFLYFTGYITSVQIVYFILTESFFWMGFWDIWKYKIPPKEYSKIECNKRVGYICFIVFFIIELVSHISTYFFWGIPLFNNNRFDTFLNAGGWGILDKLSAISQFYVIVYSLHLIDLKRHKKVSILALVITFLFGLFTGSKGFILKFIGGYFVYKCIYKKESICIRKHYKILILAILTPVIPLLLATETSFVASIFVYFRRFIANGDIYWLALPYDTIDNVEIKHSFIYFFSRILAPFRLVSYGIIDSPIGNQVSQIVSNNFLEESGGPNSRIPILCWVLFKWAGPIVAYFIGYLSVVMLRLTRKLISYGIVGYILYGYIYSSVIVVITDPIYASGAVFPFFIFISIVLFIVLFNKVLNMK